MAEIIDAHLHIFDKAPSWSLMQAYSADALVVQMDGPFALGGVGRRVDRALIMPYGLPWKAPTATEPLPSHRAHHEVIVEACRRYPDRLVGNFMYNPYLGVEEGVMELEHLVREEGFRALKLHPTWHVYPPATSPDLVWPILEAARRLGIGVLIHTGDPPFALPLQMAPLAEAFPDLPIVLAHFGTQRLSFAEEAIEAARTHDNVWIETSCARVGNLKQGVRVLGASKLIHGSDGPFHDLYATLPNVDCPVRGVPHGCGLERERP